MSNEVLDRLHGHRRPALHLIPSPAASGFSRIGGLPNLPDDLAWPAWKGAPMSFLAQIDLAELPRPLAIPELPADGYLYFFYDQDQSTWGFDPADKGSWQVLYTTSQPSPDPRPAPDDIAEEGLFAETSISFREIETIPTMDRLEFPDSIPDDILDEAEEESRDQKEAVYEEYPAHQMGGYPNPIQDDGMELECQLASNGLYCGDSAGYDDPRVAALAEGASDWRLLLQLDTDDDAEMMWGDCGMIYFWVREADLRRRDFSGVWMVLQCF